MVFLGEFVFFVSVGDFVSVIDFEGWVGLGE